MILAKVEEEMSHNHHVCHLGSLCVPTWQLRVIKKGREGAIQRFLVINEEQYQQPQETTHMHTNTIWYKNIFPCSLRSYKV